MKCTEKFCHHPALLVCDACAAERCVSHIKLCDECGKAHCWSIDAVCSSAHQCNPAKRPTFAQEMIERTGQMLKVN
jgi:hypothetical protein